LLDGIGGRLRGLMGLKKIDGIDKRLRGLKKD
jgi:hypothetical protein